MTTKLYKEKIINNKKIPIYNAEAFTKLKAAGQLAKATLDYIAPYVKVGITTNELDSLIHNFIIKNNAIPAPLNYKGFPKSCCISLNHEICHGIPSEKKLMSGDILNIDVTVILDGFYGDTSTMFSLGKISPKSQKLMDVTKQCLDEAIKIVRPNTTLGDIGSLIQEIAHSNYFSVVEEFCGHGIGHKFHQSPEVLHYGVAGEGLVLEEGMVFTIEPMINAGKKHIKMQKNEWTAITKDFSLSAQYEHMIGVTKDDCIIFTK